MLPRSTEIQPSVAPIRNTFGSVVGGVCRHRPPLQKIFSQVITGGGVLVCAPLGCVILTSVLMGGWISGMLCLGCVSIPQVGLGNRAQIKFEKKTNTFIWKLPIFRIFSTFGKSKCGFQIGSHEGEPRLELECAKSEIGGLGFPFTNSEVRKWIPKSSSKLTLKKRLTLLLGNFLFSEFFPKVASKLGPMKASRGWNSSAPAELGAKSQKSGG